MALTRTALVLLATAGLALAGCSAASDSGAGNATGPGAPAAGPGTVSVSDLGRDFTEAAPRPHACYAAAYFAEVLRNSPYAGQVRLSDLAAIASGAASRTGDPAISALADLIGRAGG